MLPTITLIIPTLNAYACISNSPALCRLIQRYPTLIIDSSSADASVSFLQTLGAKVLVIPQQEFNHGATREMARQQTQTEFVVYLTQDAVPLSEDLIEHLLAPMLQDPEVAVSYARQLPREQADALEAFPRYFNYGPEAQVRSIADTARYGVYTFFCSNSCAAYRNSALAAIGGFKRVRTNEDYFAVAELLQQGYKIAYVPEAKVQHSHAFSLWQEFQRYFETGYVRAEHPIIQTLVGQAEKRGSQMFTQLMQHLFATRPQLIPYAVMQTAVKWLGFRLGFYAQSLPLALQKFLGWQ